MDSRIGFTATECVLYQVALCRGADPHFVPLLLQFLDKVNEHVGLGQVLRTRDSVELVTMDYFHVE